MQGQPTLPWLFFSFSGRLGRKPYALAGLFCYMARSYPLYRIIVAPNEEAANFWGGIFILVAFCSFFALVPLAAKRIQDFGKPTALAFLCILLDILMYLPLCFIQGDAGPNRYGAAANQPK